MAAPRRTQKSPELLKTVSAKRRRLHSSSEFTTANSPDSGLEYTSECFHTLSTNVYISLAPVYAHDPVEGVKAQHLDPLLMSYLPAAGGVVLAYYNLKLFGQQAEKSAKKAKALNISHNKAIVSMWISVDFLAWKPRPQDDVTGWVFLQSSSYIKLLIHDTFQATIRKHSIPKSWKFVQIGNASEATEDIERCSQAPDSRPGQGYWQDSDGKKVEGYLRFTVSSLNVSHGQVSLDGSLLDKGTQPGGSEVAEQTKHQSVSIGNGEPRGGTGIAVTIHDIDSPILAHMGRSASCQLQGK